MAVTYRQAGVDIDAGDALVERIKPLARSTRIAEVLEDVGGFGGLCALPSDVDDPVLVSGTDGVGTKHKIAFLTGKHDTIGQDLVAMSVNDIITTGARPLFFLDYFVCGRLDVSLAERVISGIAAGCRLAGCALLGGETAEHPGMYPDGEYDLAGFAVGVVSRSKILGARRVKEGDALIGVASSGLHSNGFSLARLVIARSLRIGYDAKPPELERTIGEELLTPTRIYAKAQSALARALGDGLHALCHITGGGIPDNLPRVLPEGALARVHFPTPRPAIFDVIARGGPVEEAEMRRTFNLGVGLVAAVERSRENDAIQALEQAGERAFSFGDVVASESGGEPIVEIV